MNRLNAARQEAGLTLVEVLMAGLLIGILAAVSAPNIIGMLNKNQVQNGLDMLQAALEDAQRQAIRNGKPCVVELGESSADSEYFNQILATGDPNSTPAHYCFSSVGVNYNVETSNGQQILRLPQGLRIATNIPPDAGGAVSLTFSPKGHIVDFVPDNLYTLVVFTVDEATETTFENDAKHPRKCLIVASLLGMLRSGDYDTTTAPSSESITSDDCTPGLEGTENPPTPSP